MKSPYGGAVAMLLSNQSCHSSLACSAALLEDAGYTCPVLFSTAFWMLALLPSTQRVTNPSRTRSRLLQKRITILAALLPCGSRVDSTCTESTTYRSTTTILVLENYTLCVQCHVCSRSTQGSVCQRVHHYNHVCVQTTADLLLLDGWSPVHCYRKQETEVQF